ncbi:unnamed protein product, partial [Phaeothamnion confervicola]
QGGQETRTGKGRDSNALQVPLVQFGRCVGRWARRFLLLSSAKNRRATLEARSRPAGVALRRNGRPTARAASTSNSRTGAGDRPNRRRMRRSNGMRSQPKPAAEHARLSLATGPRSPRETLRNACHPSNYLNQF